MSRRVVGALLIVFGLTLVAVGVYLKRAHGLVNLMIGLHTLATLLGLLPGVLLLCWRPNADDRDHAD